MAPCFVLLQNRCTNGLKTDRCYFLLTAFLAFTKQAYIAMPLMLAFAWGTLYVGLLSLLHNRGLGLKGRATFGPEAIDYIPTPQAEQEAEAA